MNESQKNNQSEEDYLETILVLSGEVSFVHRIEVAKRMGVSQAAVNKAVKLLCERGYVYEDGKHLYLTEHGREYASTVYSKHRMLRDFLMTLGVSPQTAETDACKMEHLVSGETCAAIKQFLDEHSPA
jgi:Mn-dependent DtxR family transcriptional regulator